MNKPSWKDAPEWANYLSQDSDRLWWWFENKPVYKEVTRVWDNGEDTYGHYTLAASEPLPDTSDTLEKRP